MTASGCSDATSATLQSSAVDDDDNGALLLVTAADRRGAKLTAGFTRRRVDMACVRVFVVFRRDEAEAHKL